MFNCRRGPTKYERNWEDVTAYGREKFGTTQRGLPRGRRPSGRFRGAPRFRGRERKQYGSESSDKKEYSNGEDQEKEVFTEKEAGIYLFLIFEQI